MINAKYSSQHIGPAVQKSVLQHFIRDRCDTRSEDYVVAEKTLYRAFLNWCECSGNRSLSRRVFFEHLRASGEFERFRSNGYWWRGISLKQNTEQKSETCDCPRCVDFAYVRDELLARLDVNITHKPETHRNCSVGTYVESVGHAVVDETVSLLLSELDGCTHSLPLAVQGEKCGVVVCMKLFDFTTDAFSGRRAARYQVEVVQ